MVSPPRSTCPTHRRRPSSWIAHGFAGSQQLMRSYAVAFARNGYVVVTFDFAGHGATRAAGRQHHRDERAHTASSSTKSRASSPTPGPPATAASPCSATRWPRTSSCARRAGDPEVAATDRRLDVLAGGDRNDAAEPPGHRRRLGGRAEARGLARHRPRTPPTAAVPGVTYGDPPDGTARRAGVQPRSSMSAFSTAVPASARRSTGLTGRSRSTRVGGPVLVAQGPWILLLLAGVVALALPLSRLLPRVASPPAGGGRPLGSGVGAAAGSDDRNPAAAPGPADAFPADPGRGLSGGALRRLRSGYGGLPVLESPPGLRPRAVS